MAFLTIPQLDAAPQRIVSLVPSQTELLYHLGLNERVAGITKFCVHPQHWYRHKTRVGGTKQVNIAAVKALQPDLVIANKEENVQAQAEALAGFAPVYVTDVATVQDALHMMANVGRLTHTQAKAGELVAAISRGLGGVQPLAKPVGVLYLIWKDPFMCAGSDTFISDMLLHCGLHNLAGGERYPTITANDLQRINPPLVLLSSEPYPFKQKHIAALQALLPHSRILLADGEMFSWYGSRMLYAAGYLQQLLRQLRA
jgi:ABC-type Fe3+-hydroxamate transport system substrate-binding protein